MMRYLFGSLSWMPGLLLNPEPAGMLLGPELGAGYAGTCSSQNSPNRGGWT